MQLLFLNFYKALLLEFMTSNYIKIIHGLSEIT